MGLRDRLEAGKARLEDDVERARESAALRRAGEGFRGVRAMFEDDEGSVTVESFLVTLVRSVRDDDEGEDPEADDLYAAARKRRRRLGLVTLGAGPLVGVAGQLADLYCETAVVCDLAARNGLDLSDEEIGAHMLVLWEIADDYDAALAAMKGEPALASLLADRLSERAAEQLPAEMTVRSVAKALWDARGALDDARGGTGDALKAIVFTGRRTKAVIARAEDQLGVSAR